MRFRFQKDHSGCGQWTLEKQSWRRKSSEVAFAVVQLVGDDGLDHVVVVRAGGSRFKK